MRVRVVVGRTEGFVSSVGFMAEGMPFLCRGTNGRGLHWSTADERQQAIIELRYILNYLRAAGVVVENADVLEGLS